MEQQSIKTYLKSLSDQANFHDQPVIEKVIKEDEIKRQFLSRIYNIVEFCSDAPLLPAIKSLEATNNYTNLLNEEQKQYAINAMLAINQNKLVNRMINGEKLPEIYNDEVKSKLKWKIVSSKQLDFFSDLEGILGFDALEHIENMSLASNKNVINALQIVGAWLAFIGGMKSPEFVHQYFTAGGIVALSGAAGFYITTFRNPAYELQRCEEGIELFQNKFDQYWTTNFNKDFL